MPRHLLVLERLAGVLPVARGPMAAVADRHAVARFQAAEVPALHRTRETLALRRSGDVHALADQEMRRRQRRARLQQRVGIDAEFDQLRLGLDLRLGEVAAIRLRHVLHLGAAPAELDRGVAVLLFRAGGDNLQAVEQQHGDGHMRAVVLEQPGHPQLLCQQSGAHLGPTPGLNLDLDVHASGEVELHQRVHRLRRGLDNIEQAAMRAHLELLAAFLVDVRRAVHGETLDMRRQRDWPANPGTRALGRVHDLLRAGIQHAVIVGLKPDADILVVHRWSSGFPKRTGASLSARRRRRLTVFTL